MLLMFSTFNFLLIFYSFNAQEDMNSYHLLLNHLMGLALIPSYDFHSQHLHFIALLLLLTAIGMH